MRSLRKTLDAVLDRPNTAPIPRLKFWIVFELGNMANDVNFSQIETYINRLPVDYRLQFLSHVMRVHPTMNKNFKNSKPCLDFIVKHAKFCA